MNNKINEIIKKSIIENIPNNFGKIGGIESSHLLNYLQSGQPKLVRGDSLAINAGIVVKSENELRLWCELYLKSIKTLDYVLEWCPEQGDKYILDSIWKGKEKFYSFEGLEPFSFGNEGWHYKLADKKILVLSPFENTIYKQSEKYDKIWEGANIKEITVIKTPFAPALTKEEPNSFIYTLKSLQDKIIKENFDFAIIGCGGFSLILCDFIKSLGKPCVHLGGATQLLFGIRGKRWDIGFKDKDWYGTNEWTRVFNEEIPINKDLVEEGCYW